MGESERRAQASAMQMDGILRKIVGVKFHDAVNFAGTESRSLSIPHSKCSLVSVPGGIEAQTLSGAVRPDWIFVPFGNLVSIKYLAAKPDAPPAA